MSRGKTSPKALWDEVMKNKNHIINFDDNDIMFLACGIYDKKIKSRRLLNNERCNYHSIASNQTRKMFISTK